MKAIRGVNLGNWLVLEKWMDGKPFSGTDAEDETWLNRLLSKNELEQRMKTHRDSFITEKDFEVIAAKGLNAVRIPIPYFIFGDRPPFIGCIDYLDRAFDWAEKYGLGILIDLHTTPGCQNGFDNGGIVGVCKWAQMPEEVEFIHKVLERLALRYGQRKGLLGIEVLNEPASVKTYELHVQSNPARDPEEARGSRGIPSAFLQRFYLEAYARLRRILPEDKLIVFQDGFRLHEWPAFFRKHKLQNVALDAHFYLHFTKGTNSERMRRRYRSLIWGNRWLMLRVRKYVPVFIGEWSQSNWYAFDKDSMEIPGTLKELERMRNRFLQIAEDQKKLLDNIDGHFFWSYKIGGSTEEPVDAYWKNAWDIRRCWQNGWLPNEQNDLVR